MALVVALEAELMLVALVASLGGPDGGLGGGPGGGPGGGTDCGPGGGTWQP